MSASYLVQILLRREDVLTLDQVVGNGRGMIADQGQVAELVGADAQWRRR